MPIHTGIQDRPMAIPYSPQTKQTKHGFAHALSQEFFKNWTIRALKNHNGKPKLERKWYLLVGTNENAKNERKNAQWGLGGCWIWSSCKFYGWFEFFGKNGFIPPFLKLLNQTRLPRRANSPFFFFFFFLIVRICRN